MGTRALLVAGAGLFLWMFLSAAALEGIAEGAHVPPEARDRAIVFAADWRHGMAGNSPIYMPGFFALAIGTWMWASPRHALVRTLAEGTLLLAAAMVLAVATRRPGAAAVLQAFESATGLHIIGGGRMNAVPALPVVLAGLYTAAAWMSFVCGCRFALTFRSWRPLAPAAAVALILPFVRTWTVDDFTSLWIDRAAAGEPAAVVSAAAIPLVSWLLVRHQLYHRNHSAAKTRLAGDLLEAPATSIAADTSRIPQ